MDTTYESHIGLADEQLSVIFKSDAVTPESRNNRIHWHEGVELLFITNGSGYMFCDSQKIPLTKGNIAIANANCLHKAASDKTEMTYEYLILEPPLFELFSLPPQSITFKSIIPEHKETISLDTLCAYTGFSKYYFCRLFKEMTNQTVSSYINSFRCHEVQKLLKYTSMTVEEAAISCGFSNISHFYRMYKQHIGHVPSQDKAADNH